jgi:hypothetical protein
VLDPSAALATDLLEDYFISWVPSDDNCSAICHMTNSADLPELFLMVSGTDGRAGRLCCCLLCFPAWWLVLWGVLACGLPAVLLLRSTAQCSQHALLPPMPMLMLPAWPAG